MKRNKAVKHIPHAWLIVLRFRRWWARHRWENMFPADRSVISTAMSIPCFCCGPCARCLPAEAGISGRGAPSKPFNEEGGYVLETARGSIAAPGLVLAAGLGNIELAGMVGKTVPLKPEKGQLLVTERVAPFLPFPMSGIRQTVNGSVMIGYTNEDTGFEVSTTASAAARLPAGTGDISRSWPDTGGAFMGRAEAAYQRRCAHL